MAIVKICVSGLDRWDRFRLKPNSKDLDLMDSFNDSKNGCIVLTGKIYASGKCFQLSMPPDAVVYLSHGQHVDHENYDKAYKTWN